MLKLLALLAAAGFYALPNPSALVALAAADGFPSAEPSSVGYRARTEMNEIAADPQFIAMRQELEGIAPSDSNAIRVTLRI